MKFAKSILNDSRFAEAFVTRSGESSLGMRYPT
jgi:hypothetical protein